MLSVLGGASVGKLFKCPLCEYRSREKGNVKRHLLIHTGPETSLLPVLREEFPRPVELQKASRSTLQQIRQSAFLWQCCKIHSTCLYISLVHFSLMWIDHFGNFILCFDVTQDILMNLVVQICMFIHLPVLEIWEFLFISNCIYLESHNKCSKNVSKNIIFFKIWV